MSFPLFVIPIFVGLITQAIKPLFNRQWYAHLGKVSRMLPRYGGMPSAHTSFAFSLATVTVVVDGLSNVSFAMSAAIVIFILDDALRMRIFLSRHGQALRQLIHRLPDKERKHYPYLESRLGHKNKEVVVGAIIGVGVTLIVLAIL